MRVMSMTDEAIAAEIGQRIESIRLRRNLHQDHVAHEAGISRETYRKLTAGRGTFVNLIAVLRVLGELGRLATLIEEVRSSPVQMAKMQGKTRVRAASPRSSTSTSTPTKTTIGKATLISGRPKAKKDTSW